MQNKVGMAWDITLQLEYINSPTNKDNAIAFQFVRENKIQRPYFHQEINQHFIEQTEISFSCHFWTFVIFFLHNARKEISPSQQQ